MTPEEIAQAQAAGQLHWLLSRQNPPGFAPAIQPGCMAPNASAAVPSTGQLNEAHLKLMTPEQIVDAHQAGRFSTLLYVPPKG